VEAFNAAERFIRGLLIHAVSMTLAPRRSG
jgi:hypothetical protein